MRGCGVMECMMGSENEVWEEEWCGVEWMRKTREGERNRLHANRANSI